MASTTRGHGVDGSSRGGAGLPPVAVVVSRYNASITDRLLQGAVEAYGAAGGRQRDLTLVEAAGAFELGVLVAAAARTERFAAVVALGCIIKGETRHDRYLAQALTSGLMDLSIVSGVPVGLGVLTVESVGQAKERAGGKGGDKPGSNKGAEAMRAALHAAAQIATLRGEDLGPGHAALGRLLGGAPDKAKRAAGARPGRKGTA